MGKATYIAGEFLIEQLWDSEKASSEVERISTERGISQRTLSIAKSRLGIKSRKVGSIWLMFIPSELREKAKATVEEMKVSISYSQPRKKIALRYGVSTDWVLITRATNAVEEKKVPSGAVRIKAGMYEIEAGVGFSVEKLAELLVCMQGGEIGC